MTTTNALPPGPRMPAIVQAIRVGTRQATFAANTVKRYGDTWTMRLPGMPPQVVTCDRAAIKRLFSGDPLTKRHANDMLTFFFGPRSVAILEPAEHLARRKLETPHFHGDRMRAYGELMTALVDAELDTWRVGETITVQERAQRLTLDVILQAVLGMDDPQVRTRLARLFDAIFAPRHGLLIFEPPLRTRSRWNLLSRRFWQLMDEFDTLLRQHIAARRADPLITTRIDILSVLMTTRDESGHGLSDDELRDELATLISAGHETTATTIAWTTDILAHQPEVANKLRKRIEDGDHDYVRAAVKEALRIASVVPQGGARIVLEPFRIGNYLLPTGTPIIVDAIDLHHDPSIHDDPFTFRPERFLGHSAAPQSWLPFGGGAHRCLGAALAELELEIVLSAIHSRFTLAPISKPARPIRRGITLAPNSHGRVRVLSSTPSTRTSP